MRLSQQTSAEKNFWVKSQKGFCTTLKTSEWVSPKNRWANTFKAPTSAQKQLPFHRTRWMPLTPWTLPASRLWIQRKWIRTSSTVLWLNPKKTRQRRRTMPNWMAHRNFRRETNPTCTSLASTSSAWLTWKSRSIWRCRTKWFRTDPPLIRIPNACCQASRGNKMFISDSTPTRRRGATSREMLRSCRMLGAKCLLPSKKPRSTISSREAWTVS